MHLSHKHPKLTLQNVQTDAAKAVDVGVVNFGQEADLWGSHRIIVRKEQLKSKDTTCREKWSDRLW